MSPSTLVPQPGYYGKLPTRGDFLSRGLALSFIEPLDAWLQQAMVKSQTVLGEAWMENYLRCPFWRFALSGGVCGHTAHVGVIMPSVDNVGRYFPFTIACPVLDEFAVIELAEQGDEWFEQAEKLAFDGLEDDLDLEDFSEEVHALALPETTSVRLSGSSLNGTAAGCLLFSDPGLARHAVQRACGVMLRGMNKAYGFWWTTGAASIPPNLMYCAGLPDPEAYAAMLSRLGAYGAPDQQTEKVDV